MWLNKKTASWAVGLVFICLPILLLALASCQTGGKELLFETIERNANDIGMFTYEKREPAIMVIARAAEIDDADHTVLAQNPRIATLLRDLDFDRYFAVLVLHGRRNTGGYSVTVRQIVRQDDQVTVEAEFSEPQPGEGVIMAYTSPYHLVAVSKESSWSGQVHFALVVDGQTVAKSTHFIP